MDSATGTISGSIAFHPDAGDNPVGVNGIDVLPAFVSRIDHLDRSLAIGGEIDDSLRALLIPGTAPHVVFGHLGECIGAVTVGGPVADQFEVLFIENLAAGRKTEHFDAIVIIGDLVFGRAIGVVVDDLEPPGGLLERSFDGLAVSLEELATLRTGFVLHDGVNRRVRTVGRGHELVALLLGPVLDRTVFGKTTLGDQILVLVVDLVHFDRYAIDSDIDGVVALVGKSLSATLHRAVLPIGDMLGQTRAIEGEIGLSFEATLDLIRSLLGIEVENLRHCFSVRAIKQITGYTIRVVNLGDNSGPVILAVFDPG